MEQYIQNKCKKTTELVQNFAGRIVLGLRKYDCISEGLKSLKWLPIADKLFLNDSVMVHKCLIGRALIYITEIHEIKKI